MRWYDSYQPPERPRGLLRWGFNLPIALYRLRLGWLAGHRFMLLTHQGRKTGKLRHTVLEVVSFNRDTQESVVLSAYGERADWYQNIRAHPEPDVQTGWSRYRALYRLLEPEERLAALRIYQRRYKRAFAAVMRFLGHPYDGGDESLRTLAQEALMVAFRPIEPAPSTAARRDAGRGAD